MVVILFQYLTAAIHHNLYEYFMKSQLKGLKGRLGYAVRCLMIEAISTASFVLISMANLPHFQWVFNAREK